MPVTWRLKCLQILICPYGLASLLQRLSSLISITTINPTTILEPSSSSSSPVVVSVAIARSHLLFKQNQAYKAYHHLEDSPQRPILLHSQSLLGFEALSQSITGQSRTIQAQYTIHSTSEDVPTCHTCGS